jgi:pilus assembly protein CpaB
MRLPLRLPNVNRNWLMFGGALALGLVGFHVSQNVLQRYKDQIDAQLRGNHKMVAVIYANQDLPAGATIKPALFDVHQVPQEYVSSSAIPPKFFRKIAGLKLAAPMKSGDTLLKVSIDAGSATFSATLQNGNRALTTEVDEVNSISGLLRPGDHIDLLVTAQGTKSGAKDVTFPLLSNVEVLATGQSTRQAQGSQPTRTYTTITMSVDPQDAERIIVAKNSGRLTAVLRNPDDTHANALAAMNIDQLLPKNKGGEHTVAVQYIIGGR